MKQRSIYYCAFLIFLFSTSGLGAQEATAFTEKTDPDGRPRPNTIEFVPNEIIVKYKDGVEVTPEKLLNSSISLKKVGNPAEETKIIKAVKLFPGAQMKKSLRVVKTPQGNDMVIPNLHNIYKIVLEEKKSTGYNPYDLNGIIEELKTDPDVEYAEPNYIYSIGDFTPSSPIMDACEAQEWAEQNSANEGTGLVPNDPLYSQQWGIPACNIDDVWLTHTGDTTSVISILDTGVDWLHPDLAPNIWINTAEIPDNGMDDDGNGYIDDVRGWDFINNDNDPKDDNSHGTHCAGIAAAVGDNGIGIAGVNWKARIMPVKVFQSSGRGDAATISQGVIYASTNGADVLSMSFGGYAESITMRNALANAYSTSVLVAAAGNDGKCIGPGKCPDYRPGQPLFPGAFSFVLGVQAPPLPPNGFTNYDQDGPVFSGYPEEYNYELSAPGVSILSCAPGGNYRSYSGTSMSTPIVAGAISLYRELKPGQSQELMWGNFINTSSENIDLFDALNIIPKPVINITKYVLSDTLSGGDKDWKADAGETIQIEVFVRNSWGTADSVYVGLEFEEFEDTTTAIILQKEVKLGAIGSYSTLSNFIDPLEIAIAPGVAHGRDIRFRINSWQGKNHLFQNSVSLLIRVEHGTELIGIIDDTMRITPGKFWLVSNSFKIGPNGVLIIEPGTTLKIEKQISNYGQIIANGTHDSIIQISGPLGFNGFSSGKWTFKNTNFSGFNSGNTFNWGYGFFENCKFEDMYIGSPFFGYGGIGTTLKNCELFNINCGYVFNQMPINCEKVNFYNIKTEGIFASSPGGNIINCNFSNLSDNCNTGHDYLPNFTYNNFLTTAKNFYISSPGLYQDVPDNYWGTMDSLIISKKVLDFWDDPDRSLLRYQPFLERPAKNAHGCVWKIVVNGKDSQDEFKMLDALGIGKHKFETYFNRPMDIAFTPSVTMGVRYPFNQVSINEEGAWSTDSLTYTAYKTLGLSESDGIHRIQVMGGKDTEGFDLVPENERFNVNVQSQGSLSNGFLATPGMGKVNLDWEAPDEYVGDLLGYNMYRFTLINDSVMSDTTLISQSMLIDTTYTDYAVVPGTNYFYTYKTVRTNFTESSFSKVVAATPYTAAKGDANGDLAVNVSDIISTVSYILIKNPQPFILEAADYNSDGTVNVLDITGIVKKILNPSKKAYSESKELSVTMFVRGDTLFVDSPVSLGGIQFTVRNTNTTNFEVLDALKSFERATISDTDSLFFLSYSMTGKTFGPGIVPLLRFNNKFVAIEDIVLSTSGGNSVNVDFKGENGTTIVSTMRDGNDLKAFPNPFSGETKISFKLPVKTDKVTLSIYNTLGKKVDEIIVKDLRIGDNSFMYQSNLNQGLYILRMTTEAQGKISIEKSLKLLIK